MPLIPFLINPPKRAKRRAAHARRKVSTRTRVVRSVKRRARAHKKRFSAAQLAAQRKFVAMVRRRAADARKARSAPARSNSPRRTGGSKMATRRRKRRATSRHRRRRHAVAANPRRRRRRRVMHRAVSANPRRHRRRHVRANPRRRRHYRRNPGVAGLGGGFVKTLTRGVVDGFTVSLGRGVTGVVASKIPFGQTTTIGQGAMQLLVGTALSMAVKKFAKSDRAAAFFLAGAASKAIGTIVTPMLPATMAPFLGEVGTYPAVAFPRMGTYPAPMRRLSGWAGAPGNATVEMNENDHQQYDDEMAIA